MPAAVMPIKGALVEGQQTGEPADGVVEPTTREGRAVHALVHGGEHGDEGETEGERGQDHHRRGRGSLQTQGIEPGEESDGRQVSREAQASLGVETLLERADLIRAGRLPRPHLWPRPFRGARPPGPPSHGAAAAVRPHHPTHVSFRRP